MFQQGMRLCGCCAQSCRSVPALKRPLSGTMLRYRPPISTSRPLDIFRAVQVEIAKYDRLTSAFPDLALQEPDKCMIVLHCLDQEVKRYILLHSKIDSLVQLEQAIRFYDANLRILQFSEKPGKGQGTMNTPTPCSSKGVVKGREKGKRGTRVEGRQRQGSWRQGRQRRGETAEMTRTVGRTKERARKGARARTNLLLPILGRTVTTKGPT